MIGISGGYTWGILDADFNLIDTYEGTERVEGYTRQGICCDANKFKFGWRNRKYQCRR